MDTILKRESTESSLNNLSSEGSSSTHDPHHVAQKFTKTTEPLRSDNLMRFLLISVNSKSGGVLPTLVIFVVCGGLIMRKVRATAAMRMIRRMTLFFSLSNERHIRNS